MNTNIKLVYYKILIYLVKFQKEENYWCSTY